ncbi:MAG: hypothetical protein H7210_07580 [Pyrinomonadaceae bacterium]|nr:hypothetical protein [Phycisphaerales bacterium]
MEVLSFNTPIGHLLMEQGVLSLDQCNQILQEQQESGRPFGALAEELFGIASGAVEKAWADQYASMAQWVDPEVARVDPAVIGLVSADQAWKFHVIPMSMRGDQLTVCTTRDSLAGAVDFVNSHFSRVCYFMLATPEHMTRALTRHYPAGYESREMHQASRLAAKSARDAA